jgi:hypothetical protein
MTTSHSAQSPLARLVLFMTCLAIAGSIVAGAHYLAVDLPTQEAALYPPANSESCTPVYTGYCGSRSTICRVRGTDFTWYQSCMKDYGCCV